MEQFAGFVLKKTITYAIMCNEVYWQFAHVCEIAVQFLGGLLK